jgi:hypothetical protein
VAGSSTAATGGPTGCGQAGGLWGPSLACGHIDAAWAALACGVAPCAGLVGSSRGRGDCRTGCREKDSCERRLEESQEGGAILRL